MREVAIIDYGMGNLRSVVNAVEAVEGTPVVVQTPEDLRQAERIILPGVGAFGDGIKNLRERGWIDPMVTRHRPVPPPGLPGDRLASLASRSFHTLRSQASRGPPGCPLRAFCNASGESPSRHASN